MVAPAFNQVKVTWEPPAQDTWKCRRAVYVIKYQNDTSSGYVEIEPANGNQYEFVSQPGRKWIIEMRTQTMNDNGEKGEGSDWSPPVMVTTPKGLPGQIDLECTKVSYDQAQCTWDLDSDWSHGVDVTYQLKQRGNCPPKYNQPFTEYNVQNRRYLLQVETILFLALPKIHY